jgi:hypothetical protein
MVLAEFLQGLYRWLCYEDCLADEYCYVGQGVPIAMDLQEQYYMEVYSVSAYYPRPVDVAAEVCNAIGDNCLGFSVELHGGSIALAFQDKDKYYGLPAAYHYSVASVPVTSGNFSRQPANTRIASTAVGKGWQWWYAYVKC